MLINILKRARFLAQEVMNYFALQPLGFSFTDLLEFSNDRTDNIIGKFSQIDDFDIFTSIKVWITTATKFFQHYAGT